MSGPNDNGKGKGKGKAVDHPENEAEDVSGDNAIGSSKGMCSSMQPVGAATYENESHRHLAQVKESPTETH